MHCNKRANRSGYPDSKGFHSCFCFSVSISRFFVFRYFAALPFFVVKNAFVPPVASAASFFSSSCVKVFSPLGVCTVSFPVVVTSVLGAEEPPLLPEEVPEEGSYHFYTGCLLIVRPCVLKNRILTKMLTEEPTD